MTTCPNTTRTAAGAIFIRGGFGGTYYTLTFRPTNSINSIEVPSWAQGEKEKLAASAYRAN